MDHVQVSGVTLICHHSQHSLRRPKCLFMYCTVLSGYRKLFKRLIPAFISRNIGSITTRIISLLQLCDIFQCFMNIHWPKMECTVDLP